MDKEEIAALARENAELRAIVEELTAQAAEIEALKAKLAKAVDALEWYADEGNYLEGRNEGGAPDSFVDRGSKARDTLKEIQDA